MHTILLGMPDTAIIMTQIAGIIWKAHLIADKQPQQSAANAHSSAQYYKAAVYKQLAMCCC